MLTGNFFLVTNNILLNLIEEFNSLSGLMLDIQGVLASTYSSPEEALRYLKNQSASTTVTFQGFSKVINSLLPKRI